MCYHNLSLPFEARAAQLVSLLTLEEKALQLSHDAPAIPRLGIRSWNWWNEASHGVTPAVVQEFKQATCFPTCLAMSQTWNPELIESVTTAISDEIRALRNTIGKELDYWCPTVNMGRDPRWGRNDENFGEDPYLAGKLAAAYVRGLQGQDPKYLKAISTPKHFAANNSEYNRCNGSSNMDEATLREYYLPVFERCIREGGAYSIMTSYNRINGVPSSANHHLIREILREEWGFKGYIVSDDGAVGDVGPNTSLMFGMLRGHFYGKTMPEASALCVEAGTDICTGIEHDLYLMDAVRQGLITEDRLDRALIRIFTARFKLGEFDDPRPFAGYGEAQLCADRNAALARQAATESLTLLKNEGNLLPIEPKKVRSIAVIGPNAIYRQFGSYSIGGNPHMDCDTRVSIPPLAGICIEAEKQGMQVTYRKGWNQAKHEFERPEPTAVLLRAAADAGLTPEEYLKQRVPESERALRHAKFAPFMEFMNRPEVAPRHPVTDADLNRPDEELMAEALEAAAQADLVIVVAGTDPSVTREGADRQSLDLPYDQDDKIRKILKVNPNTVVVCVTSGPVTGAFLNDVPALLNATYAGESQGAAIADVLFGNVCPSGRLSETWFFDGNDLPHISEYGLRPFDTSTERGRTYLYYLGKVRFPFGYGLSYTNFSYSHFRLNREQYDANDTVTVAAEVCNTGSRAGAEVVQLYCRKRSLYDNKPLQQLVGFQKVFLQPGEKKTVVLSVPVHELKFWNAWRERFEVEEGDYAFWLGRGSGEEAVLARAAAKISGQWNAPLSAVTMLADRYLLQSGEETSVHLTAAREDAAHLNVSDLPFTFQSSDETVAKIENGKIIALQPGAVTLTASLTMGGETKTDSIGVCVTE
ncbi:MAG TPA: glycoside hydrolase family 3 C-terminal domain-containing protein [Candidatus Limiplasma sp.]|nr:glycoside hydrolase family 3 C-terminal domain-containing protein [Candidatus Limiplasma sp.]